MTALVVVPFKLGRHDYGLSVYAQVCQPWGLHTVIISSTAGKSDTPSHPGLCLQRCGTGVLVTEPRCQGKTPLHQGLLPLGIVKTTLEIPDTLMRRVKLRAVLRNQKLKDAIARLLEIGMAATSDSEHPRRPPKPVRLKGRGQIDIGSIEAAIESGRD